jgi:Fic family protein
MDHVAVMSDDPSFRWLDRVILDLHFDACIFQRDKSPGRWRTGPASVMGRAGDVVYEAPGADQVPDLMGEVIAWLDGGDLDVHVSVRAAMAHLHVVSVHPFRDGNGRVARLVQSLVLARDGLLSPELGSIEPWLAARTAAYFEQLDRTHGATYDPTMSAREWVGFCVEAHIEQGRSRLAMFAAAALRWRALEAMVDDNGWPDRLVIALEQALHGGATRSSYTREADVHENTAQSDLRRLVDANLVERIGRGPATSYVATDRLRRAITNDHST